jgi:polyisoprenoid-binding protein YceI
MLRLPRVLIGGVAVILLVFAVVAAFWWFAVRSDAELATNAPEIPAELAGDGDAGATARSYRIIPERSEAAYFADEKLASLPLPSTAKGATNDISGEFHLTEDGFGLDPARESRFTVDLTTITSDREMRDNRVRTQGLQVDQFPTATFVATAVSGVAPGMADGEEHTFQLTGIMDLHGVQREITWEVKARREGGVFTALATTNFLYEDFGIAVLNIGGFVTVEEDVTLQVQVVAEAVDA